MRLTALTTCLCAPSAMAEDEFGMRLPASLRLFGWLEMELARSFASVGMKRAFGECELGYGGLRSMPTSWKSRCWSAMNGVPSGSFRPS